MQNLHLPVVDNSVPSFVQVDEFIATSQKIIQDEKRAVVVHCAQGIGRTGVMLACFIAVHKNLPGHLAVEFVRERRGAISTPEQERFVEEYYQYRAGLNPNAEKYDAFQQLHLDNILIYANSLCLDKVVTEWQKIKKENGTLPPQVLKSVKNMCKQLGKMDLFYSLFSPFSPSTT
eukprot:Phypoly_transcript_11403.p1 GENE.Phypoly_transcript_11403~~Phypoly_transcript_11403.p1  ORF type:complete len:175 (+),score=25.88 Phypoly_transcript_11403:633-1157(+)